MNWLNRTQAVTGGKDYSVWDNVKRDFDNKVIDGAAYEVLRGLHERGLDLPPTPSKKDIKFLKKFYGMLL